MKQARHNILRVRHKQASSRNSSAILCKRTRKKLLRTLSDDEFRAQANERKPDETILYVKRQVKLVFTQMDGYRRLEIVHI